MTFRTGSREDSEQANLGSPAGTEEGGTLGREGSGRQGVVRSGAQMRPRSVPAKGRRAWSALWDTRVRVQGEAPRSSGCGGHSFHMFVGAGARGKGQETEGGGQKKQQLV